MTKIPIEQFYDPDCVGLRSPWIVNGKVAASNGGILILCDPAAVSAFAPIPPDFKPPELTRAMKGWECIRKWRSLPDWETCPKCGTSGRVTCPVCEGTGLDAEGCKCSGCKAAGTLKCGCLVKIDNRRLFRDHAMLLRLLPDCAWAPNGTSANGSLFLRFTGGRGVIMPVAT